MQATFGGQETAFLAELLRLLVWWRVGDMKSEVAILGSSAVGWCSVLALALALALALPLGVCLASEHDCARAGAAPCCSAAPAWPLQLSARPACSAMES